MKEHVKVFPKVFEGARAQLNDVRYFFLHLSTRGFVILCVSVIISELLM